jgi:non-specific serine/threonine protein kinase
MPQQIASSLGIGEQAGRRLTDTLSDFLQPKQLLLILDNCEHLVTACAHLVEMLLRTCPTLRVLATSREALNISGELVWLVPSLPLPETSHLPPLEGLVKYGAIQLFVERAAAVLPPFKLTPENAAAVLQICHRLDGIPPGGKQFSATGIEIYRFDGGKIVEHWLEADKLGLMQQLGVVPPPGQAS